MFSTEPQPAKGSKAQQARLSVAVRVVEADVAAVAATEVVLVRLTVRLAVVLLPAVVFFMLVVVLLLTAVVLLLLLPVVVLLLVLVATAVKGKMPWGIRPSTKAGGAAPEDGACMQIGDKPVSACP